VLLLISHLLLWIYQAVQDLVSKYLKHCVRVSRVHLLRNYVICLKSLVDVFWLCMLEFIRYKAESVASHRHGAEDLRPVDVDEANEGNVELNVSIELVLDVLVCNSEDVENYCANLKVKAVIVLNLFCERRVGGDLFGRREAKNERLVDDVNQVRQLFLDNLALSRLKVLLVELKDPGKRVV